MDEARDFTSFAPTGCTATVADGGGACALAFPVDAEGFFATEAHAVADPATWAAARFIWFDAVNKGPHSMALTLSFWDADTHDAAPDLVSTIGLLPGIETRVTFPLGALDSQRMFLSRTPGKLKTVIHGTRVRSLARLAIGSKKCSSAQRLEIRGLHLCSEEPPYPLEKRALVDRLGQWAGSSWRGKTAGEAAMAARMKDLLARASAAAPPPDRTRLGSWKERTFAASGNFRTEHDGTRWWLVDPEGFPFYSVGVDCVRPGEGCNTTGIESLCGPLPAREGPFAECWSDERFMGLAPAALFDYSIANLVRVFGPTWREAWRRITRANLVKWGFNTVGNWSDPGFCRWSGLPWVFPMSDFPATGTWIFRDFPDVFSPEYEKNAASFARQMEPLARDSTLIGYFLRNEPEWAFIKELVIAEELLESTASTHSRDALIRFLAERHLGKIEELNAAWGSRFSTFDALRAPVPGACRRFPGAEPDLRAFSRIMIDRYVRVPSEAVRRVDPRHLNLGMRYGYVSSNELLAGSDAFDVFSINCYDQDPAEAIDRAGRATKLPIMIGEFHFGALDRGVSATGIRAAASQEERGHAYRFYVEAAAAHPSCVGTHYFQYNEQPALGRFDGENYDIGLVDVCQAPLQEFIDGILECHRGLYGLAAAESRPTTRRGKLIHPIFF